MALSLVQRAPWPSGRELRSAAMLDRVFFAMNYACVFWAEQRVASGYAAIASSTLPVSIFRWGNGPGCARQSFGALEKSTSGARLE
jgi:hypothetical protein